nr:DUF6471 domain-containing protein [Aurantimonas marina]
MTRKGVTRAQPAEKLAAISVKEREANIANKLSRGKFMAVVMAACYETIGSDVIRL